MPGEDDVPPPGEFRSDAVARRPSRRAPSASEDCLSLGRCVRRRSPAIMGDLWNKVARRTPNYWAWAGTWYLLTWPLRAARKPA